MNAMEVVETAKKSGTCGNIDDEILYGAVKRLELMIQIYTGTEFREFDKETSLLACGGGVAVGYDDMYDAYVKREACRIREDWECYGNYDALFNLRYDELRKEIIRSGKRNVKGGSFSPDWRWT